jgi:hypothetical protein
MTVIQADFAPPKKTFDYASFRAEFVRRKRLTRYQRVIEDADKAHAEALVDNAAREDGGRPHWASVQEAPGIASIIHEWQAERFEDPNNGRIRYTQGVLETVRHPVVEPHALAAIEHLAKLWQVERGRTFLTPDEFRVLNLSKRYLHECDRHEWKAKNSGFEPVYRKDGSLVEKIMFSWVSRMTGFAVSYVETLLISCENVYHMRAAIGMDGLPEVRLVVPRTRGIAAASGDGERVA